MDTKAECPKCRARMAVTVSQKTPGPPGSASDAAQKNETAEAAPAAAKKGPDPNSFAYYLQQHFAGSRGSAIWGVCAGVAAALLLSLAKPVLGFGGMLVVCEVILVVAFAAGLAYAIEQYLAFVAQKQEKAADEDTRSWLAPFLFGCLMFLIPIGVLTVIESFTPRYGLVATIIPGLRGDDAIQAEPWSESFAAASPQQVAAAPSPAADPAIAPRTHAPQPTSPPPAPAQPPPAPVPPPSPKPVEPTINPAPKTPPQKAPPTIPMPADTASEKAPDADAKEPSAAGDKPQSVLPPPEPEASVVHSLFVIQEGDAQGPPVEGAKVELWRRTGENAKPISLKTALTDSRGEAAIALDFGAGGPPAGEYGATVSRGAVSKSWILSDYPEAAGWNLHLPAR